MSTLDNMNDMERNRVAYVQQMEQKVEHLTREYQRYKTLAETWEPRVTTEMDAAKQLVKVGLQFGGKHIHATVTFNTLQTTDLTTAISAVTDALVESLVVEKIRGVLAPKLDECMKNAKSVQGAGQW